MMRATACANRQLPVHDLAATLRGTPYHKWPTLMHQLTPTPAGNQTALFEQASLLVQGEWDLAEVHAQLRQALTSAATEIIQAMTTLGAPSSGDAVDAGAAETGGADTDIHALAAYLSNAGQALRAAEALRPTIAVCTARAV